MYKCNSCGTVFDEPKTISESRGEFWGIPCFELIDMCPCCEDTDFDEYDDYSDWDDDVESIDYEEEQ